MYGDGRGHEIPKEGITDYMSRFVFDEQVYEKCTKNLSSITCLANKCICYKNDDEFIQNGTGKGLKKFHGDMFDSVHIFHDTTLTNKQTGEPILDKFGKMKACGRFFNRSRKYDLIEDREPY